MRISHSINPDEMTPREALDALYRLKGLAAQHDILNVYERFKCNHSV